MLNSPLFVHHLHEETEKIFKYPSLRASLACAMFEPDSMTRRMLNKAHLQDFYKHQQIYSSPHLKVLQGIVPAEGFLCTQWPKVK